MKPPIPARPPVRRAGPELLVLARWDEFTGWLFDHTAKWPNSARFTVTQRVQNHCLDVLEMLVEARYQRSDRVELLRRLNLVLERMRFLLRVAVHGRVMPRRGFETAMRGVDETGRMIHGWRVGCRSPRRPEGGKT